MTKSGVKGRNADLVNCRENSPENGKDSETRGGDDIYLTSIYSIHSPFP
jgi:hypothetical protein